jgi:hypothetical protein
MYIAQWLLLDSRGVDVLMAYNSTFVILSSLKSLFFNGLKGLDHRVGHRAEIEASEHGVPGIISRKFSHSTELRGRGHSRSVKAA